MVTRRLGLVGAFVCSVLFTNSCGYFLYPERVGQVEGKIDPTVVILDALGLLIGIIPGVVAFAVDLTTGTIYLPPGGESAIEKHQDRSSSLQSLPLQPLHSTEAPVLHEDIARQLSEKLGIEVEANTVQYYKVVKPNARLALLSLD